MFVNGMFGIWEGEGSLDSKVPARRGGVKAACLRAVRPAGVTRASWDGANDAGARLRPGAYFAKLSAGGTNVVKRIVLEH